MSRKSTDARFSRLMMDIFPRGMLRMRTENAERPTPNAQHRMSRREILQPSTFLLQPCVSLCGRSPAKWLRNWPTRDAESSRRRWNLLRCAKTWDAARHRKAETGNRKVTEV